jgi:hypothetical protein
MGLGRSEVGVEAEGLALAVAVDGGHDARLLVVADALFEEVGLALQRDHVHPLEGVRRRVLPIYNRSGKESNRSRTT